MPIKALVVAFGQDLVSTAQSANNPGDPVITRRTTFNSDHIQLLQYFLLLLIHVNNISLTLSELTGKIITFRNGKSYAASMNLLPGVSDRRFSLSLHSSVKPVYITYVLSKLFSTPLICQVELRTTETLQCHGALGMQVDLVLWLGAGARLTEITKATFCICT